MNFKNALTPSGIRAVNNYLAIKSTGAYQCGIENIRTVGGSNQDNSFIRLKTIHLNQ